MDNECEGEQKGQAVCVRESEARRELVGLVMLDLDDGGRSLR